MIYFYHCPIFRYTSVHVEIFETVQLRLDLKIDGDELLFFLYVEDGSLVNLISMPC